MIFPENGPEFALKEFRVIVGHLEDIHACYRGVGCLARKQLPPLSGDFLVVPTMNSLAQRLQSLVMQRTNRRVWNLAIDVLPERVVLRGETNTFYAKQLAQESVREVLPQMALENAIQVA